ncbi:MAG TPA: sodium-dependent transporter [Parachlamydiales bacterium]|nr:MAG: sodium-dependent transporter [Chlamydiae bacterium RIFCSPHIGHO2_12_FULL_49_32]OGN68050.1 MAG: sodium-dependent transporter [Chlamydiae bacterium RIFCSPLOWO2_02_FULL_49_12]OGN70951.1 MAG: sodium-dependent transporter [Chlamydiae bacterium RIFCSPLOWO2_12_FULL_49_12]HAZ16180.1 sodium-dependent transporter [Parachlamydiales bacterium]
MKQQREHWGSRIGFVLAAAGSAIGLGSLWKFPFLVGKHGGGLFVLLYIFFTFLISLPIFLAELVIGRHTQRSPIFAYSELSEHSPHWKLVGWFNVITSFIITSFYCVIGGWCVNYALMSLSHFTVGRSTEEIRNVFTVMARSGDINIFWFLVFLILNIGIVYGGIRKGIEYWSKILTPLLFILLFGLFIYSTTLPGFVDAVKFIFCPDLSLASPSTVLNALGMSFFTISVGLGIIVTYGSYMKSSEDIPKTGLIVASMTVLVSIMTTLIIFPIIFTFNFPTEGGPGLIFQALPVLFSKLPGTLVLSTLFFILVVFTALTSSISLFEVLVANLMELLSWPRGRSVLISAAGTFVLGIPSALAGSKYLFPSWTAMYGQGNDFMNTLDNLASNWMMPIAALLTTLFLGWNVSRQLIYEEFLKGTSLGYLMKGWFFLIRWIAPIAIILIILQEGKVIEFNKLFTFFQKQP